MMKGRMTPSPSASNLYRSTVGQQKQSKSVGPSASVSRTSTMKSVAPSKPSPTNRWSMPTSKSISSHNVRTTTPRTTTTTTGRMTKVASSTSLNPRQPSGGEAPCPPRDVNGVKKASTREPVKPDEPSNDDPTPMTRDRRGSYTIRRHANAEQKPPIPSADDGPKEASVCATAAKPPIPGLRKVSVPVVTSDPKSNSSGVSARPTSNSESGFRSHMGRTVLVNGQPGILRYFGPIHCLDGLFCGIEFEKAIGLHDGQIGGTRYFSSRPRHGTFCPMERVRIVESNMVQAQVQSTVEGELLTDIEPNLLDTTSMDDSVLNATGGFELSSSLLFLKGSRLPGMDVSLTPSELLGQVFNGNGNDNGTRQRDMDKTMTMDIDYENLIDPTIQTTPTSDLINSNFRPPPTGQSVHGSLVDLNSGKSNEHPRSGKDSMESVLRHNAMGFDAMATLLKHYAEVTVPELSHQLAESQKAYDDLKKAQLAQSEENRMLRMHCEKAVERAKKTDQKLQVLENGLQAQQEHHASLDQQMELEQYKADVKRLEKLIKDYQLEINSLNEVADIRNQELKSLQQKCGILEKASMELEKCRMRVQDMEWKMTQQAQTIDMKTQREHELKNMISKLEKQVLERHLTIHTLLTTQQATAGSEYGRYLQRPVQSLYLDGAKTDMKRRRSQSVHGLDALD